MKILSNKDITVTRSGRVTIHGTCKIATSCDEHGHQVYIIGNTEYRIKFNLVLRHYEVVVTQLNNLNRVIIYPSVVHVPVRPPPIKLPYIFAKLLVEPPSRATLSTF